MKDDANQLPTQTVALSALDLTNASTVSPVPHPDSETTGPLMPGGSLTAHTPIVPGYEIIDVLGRGGMGVVYKARQVGLNRVVAIKMILSDEFGSDSDKSRLHRFQIEAEAVARVSHSSIVQIYEVGSTHGRPFLALEYCGNGSLTKLLDGTPLPERRAAELCESLARAMEVAHREGIVHRDLKPANILFGADNAPKIGDFGLARLFDSADDQTRSGTILGTPSYMPPEQALGAHAAPAADIYALGTILYECLTGRPPFKGATILDTLSQVRNQEPVPPRALNSKVSKDLETVCLKCLSKEPARRYGNANELAEDLRRFLDGKPIVARPVGRIEHCVKWIKRDPLAAALIALAFVSMSLGTTISLLKYREAERQRSLADSALEEAQRQRLDAEHARDLENLARTSADEALAQNRQRLAFNYFLAYSRICASASRIANAKTWEDGEMARRDFQRMSEWLPVDDSKVKKALLDFRSELADWIKDAPPANVKRKSLDLARACQSWWIDTIGREWPALVADTRRHMYSRICRVATEMTRTENWEKGQFACREFWELYWGELAIVESADVSRQMVRIGNVLDAWLPGAAPPPELLALVANLREMCDEKPARGN